MGNDNRPPVKDRLRKKEATTNKIRITMTAEVANDLAEAEQDLALAQMQAQSDPENEVLKQKAEMAKDAYEMAKAAAFEDSIEFVFRNIGRKAFDKLIDDHPPTDAEKKELEKSGGNPDQLQWSPNSFPQALVTASIVHPKLDREEVEELWDDDNWGGDELTQLFYTALGAQQKSRILRMGNV